MKKHLKSRVRSVQRMVPLSRLCAVLVLGAACSAAYAQHSDKETKEDIQRHRAMAAAHESAAQCLASGKQAAVCEKELQAACKGLAIGKYCGMKHGH